jgi:cation:H+ antiporter
VEILSVVFLVAGLVLLIVGAESMVRGASRLAESLGVSPLVVGLTVVAFATSAPELAVTLTAAAKGTGDLAFGNVIGSNLFNILVILGLSAVVAPLWVDRKLIRVDVPIMIGVSVVAGIMALDGSIGRLDGFVLVAGLVGYLLLSLRLERSRMKDVASGKTEAQNAQAIEDRKGVSWRTPAWSVFLVVAGLVLLVLGSHWLVTGSVAIARVLGISERVIGLTLVAGGTSLPELATSIMASIRGQRDIAVGNLVGSNLFNLLCVLGLASLVLPVPVNDQALHLDVPVMIGSAIICLPIFARGHRIFRTEGALLLACYGAYLTWILVAR